MCRGNRRYSADVHGGKCKKGQEKKNFGPEEQPFKSDDRFKR